MLRPLGFVLFGSSFLYEVRRIVLLLTCVQVPQYWSFIPKSKKVWFLESESEVSDAGYLDRLGPSAIGRAGTARSGFSLLRDHPSNP